MLCRLDFAAFEGYMRNDGLHKLQCTCEAGLTDSQNTGDVLTFVEEHLPTVKEAHRQFMNCKESSAKQMVHATVPRVCNLKSADTKLPCQTSNKLSDVESKIVGKLAEWSGQQRPWHSSFAHVCSLRCTRQQRSLKAPLEDIHVFKQYCSATSQAAEFLHGSNLKFLHVLTNCFCSCTPGLEIAHALEVRQLSICNSTYATYVFAMYTSLVAEIQMYLYVLGHDSSLVSTMQADCACLQVVRVFADRLKLRADVIAAFAEDCQHILEVLDVLKEKLASFTNTGCSLQPQLPAVPLPNYMQVNLVRSSL